MFCFRDIIHFCGSKFKRPKGVYSKIFLFFFYFLSQNTACGILISQPRIKPMPSAMEEQSPNHCTHREFPVLSLFTDNHWIFPKGTIVISLILHNGFCTLIILGKGNVDPLLISLSNLLQYCFCLRLWFFGYKACGILVHWPGIEPTVPSLEGKILTTKSPASWNFNLKIYFRNFSLSIHKEHSHSFL